MGQFQVCNLNHMFAFQSKDGVTNPHPAFAYLSKKSGNGFSVIGQDIGSGDTLGFVLPSNLNEITVESLDPAIKAFPVVLLTEGFEIKHGRWP